MANKLEKETKDVEDLIYPEPPKGAPRYDLRKRLIKPPTDEELDKQVKDDKKSCEESESSEVRVLLNFIKSL